MPAEGDEGAAFEPSGRRWLRRVWHVLAGPGDEKPTYWLTRFWFLRALGLVYAVAFSVAVFQLLPLIGEDGLLPVGMYLDRVAAKYGGPGPAFWELPTIFWLDHADSTLMTVSVIGLVLALLLMLGVSHPVQLLALWFLYMSIDHVGQRWYQFGWESQLLETGFLAVFLVPLRSWRPYPRGAPVPTVLIVLLRWLIVRIMLGAGLIKLRGDPCWSDLTCLYYHFETQPIPHPLSWVFNQLPDFVLRAGVAFNHFVELVVPFFAFGPRRARHVAGVLMIAFQVTLILSGNLAFLNWLTILPCIACFDDGFLGRITPRRWRPRLDDEQLHAPPRRAHRVVAWVWAAFVAYLSLPVVANLLGGQRQAMNRSYDRLHLVNTYGAFGSVGRERFELVIEGTSDPDPRTATWTAYEFACKPGDPERIPCTITPYHRRLDWLIWFAGLEVEATGALQREDWVFHLLYKLLRGDEAVLSLVGSNPFPDEPPRYVRVLFYRYAFTEWGDGHPGWWRRELLGELVRPVSTEDEGFVGYLRWRGWLPEQD
jgi:hypothetical protein